MSQDYEKCEVIYPYNKVNDDELELKKGQIITILSKNLEDPGWWRGVLDGKVGVFPDNFVKIIKNSTDKPALNKEISVEEKYDLNSLKKELEESAPKAASPSKTLQKNPSVEKVKLRKPAQKKAAPIVPPPGVATPEKDKADVKVVGEEFEDSLDVIGSCTKLTQTTGGRVKPPGGRRPPSKLFLKENIPDLLDISVDKEDIEEEKDEKEDKDGKTEKEEAKTGKPSVMKMLDFSGVKLRETKPAIVQRPNTMKDTKDTKSQMPGWMEELNKKQANRRSAGNYLDQDSPEEPLPKTFQFSRHNALRKPVTGSEEKEDIKPGDIGWNMDLNNGTAKEEENNARDDFFTKKQEKNNEEVEITSLKKDFEDFKLKMMKEISSLNDSLETERKARKALETEILELKRRI